MLLAEASPQLLVGSADKVVLGVGSGIGNFEVCGEHGGEPIFKVVYNLRRPKLPTSFGFFWPQYLLHS